MVRLVGYHEKLRIGCWFLLNCSCIPAYMFREAFSEFVILVFSPQNDPSAVFLNSQYA